MRQTIFPSGKLSHCNYRMGLKYTTHSPHHVRRLMKQLKVNVRRPENDLVMIESAIKIRKRNLYIS